MVQTGWDSNRIASAEIGMRLDKCFPGKKLKSETRQDIPLNPALYFNAAVLTCYIRDAIMPLTCYIIRDGIFCLDFRILC